ncbi:MAG TPA: Ldh family oxidoreductase, partial [Nitrososphaeria archaeon]|nr:Ldh family oxidoreductase [Nitrososphaeria archaeon]
AMEIAVQKAKESDMALVGARNLGHVGMLAYYTRKIAKERLIGLACANAPAKVAPWGGAEKVFGTNPISIGIPVDDGPPIVIDMATSATASFKIRIALRQGKKLPPNVLLDKHGRPTTEPKDYVEGGVLLPFGGHKGYALMLVIEILASAFIGGPISKEVIDHSSTQGGFLVAAIKPALFRDYGEYTRDLKRIIHEIKNCKTMEGFSEVLLPGELEERVYVERRRSGIPIDSEMLRSLKEVAERLGIQFPKKIS